MGENREKAAAVLRRMQEVHEELFGPEPVTDLDERYRVKWPEHAALEAEYRELMSELRGEDEKGIPSRAEQP